jgi:hypothetical protein
MIKELKRLHLHDQSLEMLSFDFFTREVKIKVSIANDENLDYDFYEMLFEEIEYINMENITLESISSIDIYSFEVKEDIPKSYVKFICLLGFSKPSFEFSFRFSNVLLTKLD